MSARSAVLGALLAAGAASLQDAAPPVISLRLGADPLDSEAAHGCAVYDRDAPTTGATTACEDPVCDANDHHEGSIDCHITVRMINNDGSTEHSDLSGGGTCEGIHSFACTADRKKRSTWLYNYGAADSTGNRAEEVTFVLTIYDHEKPSITKPLPFLGGHVYRDEDLRAESCNMHNLTAPFGTDMAFGTAPCTWEVPRTAIATDNVDTTAVLDSRIYRGAIKPDHDGRPGTIRSDHSDGHLTEGLFGTLQSGPTDILIDTHILGDWRLRWEVCDKAGMYGQGGESNCIATESVVHVEDTQIPILEVVDDLTEVLECGVDRYVEKGARCKDLHDSWVDGSWHFDSSDAAGAWHLGGPSSWAMPVHTTTDEGIADNAIAEMEGDFHVEYDCEDKAKNSAATAQRTVHVRDTRAPHVEITTGITEVQLSSGATVHEGPGNPYENGDAQIDWDLVKSAAVCHDDCTDTHIDAKLHYGHCNATTMGGTVGTGELSADNWAMHADLEPGFYSVHFVCSDQAIGSTGRHTHSTCLTLVNVDKTKPIIEILGNSTLVLEATHVGTYDDDGATCSDQVDGIISQNVEVSGDIVNLAKVGTYTVLYECTDAAGNDAVPLPRTVIVRHISCPTCRITGSTTLDHEAGFAFTDEGVQCSDLIDGDCVAEDGPLAVPGASCVILPVRVTREGDSAFASDEVDVNHVGTYHVTYRAENSVGNTNDYGNDATATTCANGVHHYVRVVEIKDTLAPVIRLAYNGNAIAFGKGDETSTTTGQTAGVKNPFSGGHHDGSGHSGAGAFDLMAEQTGAAAGGWLVGAAAAGAVGLALLALSSRKASGAVAAQPQPLV